MKSAEGSARLGSKRSKKMVPESSSIVPNMGILYGYNMDYMVYLKMANLLGEMAKR